MQCSVHTFADNAAAAAPTNDGFIIQFCSGLCYARLSDSEKGGFKLILSRLE